jgi:ADP-ribose pyrophosphatase
MEKTLSKTRKFEGSLLTLDVHQVELEDGSHSSREIVLHPDAVCCVVVTKEMETVLVRQYRKPIEMPILEIPAGKIDAGEDAAVAAVRELREEVGFEDGKVEHLMDFYSSPGFCNEKLGLFLATEAVLGEQQLDEGEFIELVKVPLSRAKEMALQGELGDAKSVAGILAAAERLGL